VALLDRLDCGHCYDPQTDLSLLVVVYHRRLGVHPVSAPLYLHDLCPRPYHHAAPSLNIDLPALALCSLYSKSMNLPQTLVEKVLSCDGLEIWSAVYHLHRLDVHLALGRRLVVHLLRSENLVSRLFEGIQAVGILHSDLAMSHNGCHLHLEHC
jgi:hypothetical protein